MGRVVSILQSLGDSTPVTDLVSVFPAPLTHLIQLLTINAGLSGAASTASLPGAANPSGVLHEYRQAIAQLGGVPLGKVNLIRDPIQTKLHRLISFGTVDVVFHQNLNSLRHE